MAKMRKAKPVSGLEIEVGSGNVYKEPPLEINVAPAKRRRLAKPAARLSR